MRGWRANAAGAAQDREVLEPIGRHPVQRIAGVLLRDGIAFSSHAVADPAPGLAFGRRKAGPRLTSGVTRSGEAGRRAALDWHARQC